MGIKVTKPEVNIREKLNELDFDKVPFQKMPAGSVLQVKYLQRSADISSTATSWSTIDTLKFSPKVANSMIIVETDYSMGANAGGYIRLRLNNTTTGNQLSQSGAHIHPNSTDASPSRMHFTGYDFPNSTEEQTYTFNGLTNGTIAWFHTYGAGADSYFRITEIAQ